ncbi:tripartite tricarboxylate transporter substrate binding protein [Ramlibacter sp. AW1]|uniref:Tripartite tricarboxylate transporter substrate binding protein n=1 Tax=Ramlibacter aurantiacus TaxID=2801330 RepID=A0A936ZF44_9BURK|nr:tripartite tricarboxylate transporter substrate binding protein [Ramlibacter aurantiacus]MBL0419128.1 tripartite tricarboxylate transporter substrate binding protein [Ramlibacter aurantiacus]
MALKPFLKLCAAAAALATAGFAAGQSDYPTKPIRLIVPLAPGSVTDAVLRSAAQELQPRLGQPIVIDNRPGASGIVGTDACAKAPADGYTVCAVYLASMSINPHTVARLPYDPDRDLAPIGKLFYVTEVLFVPANLPVANLAELRAYAARNPTQVNFGTLGEGSLQELFVAWLNSEWKTSIAGIPYKGGGPISSAIASGELQAGMMGVGNFVGLMQGNKVRALAVSAEQRSPLLPHVPTMKEAGLGGFSSHVWWGLAAPAGTPAAAINRLNTEFNRLLREPRFAEFLQSRYLVPAGGTAQEFASFLKADREQAASLVKLAAQKSAR